MAKKGKSVDLGDDRIEQFMKRLASDDEFREAIERDPAATLVGAGVSPPKEKVPKKVKLPSKAALKARLKEYAAKKGKTDVPYMPFSFGDVLRGTCEAKKSKPTTPAKKVKAPKPAKAAKKPGRGPKKAG